MPASEAVMVETYVGDNSEGLVGRVRVSRLRDSLRIVGNRPTPRFTPARKGLLIAAAALIAAGLALSAGRIPISAAVLVIGGAAAALFALFIGPTDWVIRHYHASCIRLLDAESLKYANGDAVVADPYRLAFEVTDSRGRSARYVLNPETPEQVQTLMEILAP